MYTLLYGFNIIKRNQIIVPLYIFNAPRRGVPVPERALYVTVTLTQLVAEWWLKDDDSHVAFLGCKLITNSVLSYGHACTATPHLRRSASKKYACSIECGLPVQLGLRRSA